MPKQNKINNQGQVLLIVVISLAVLLGVGLSISSGTLSSITRTSRTDSLQKVTAAAEGGLESYLLKTDAQLKQVLSSTSSTATQTYPEANTKVTITVSEVTAGDTGITFDTLDPGEVATFYFAENPSTVTKTGKISCIKISTDTVSPEYMLNVVVKNPNTPEVFISVSVSAANYDATRTNNFLMEKYIYSGNAFVKSVGPTPCEEGGYQFTDAALLRIHPLTKSLANLTIDVVSNDNNLKNVTQGYKITSKGEFIGGGDATVRTIDAVKYLDSPSNMFDYAAFVDY